MRLTLSLSILALFFLPGLASAAGEAGLRHYVGAINHVHSIQMDLYMTEGQCVGSFKYVKSGVSFTLKGTVDKRELKMLETDGAGNFSGYIQLEKSGDYWSGEWFNYDKSRRQPFWIKEVPEKENYVDCCDEGAWLKSFEGELLKQPAGLFVQRSGPAAYSGRILFKDKKESYSLQQSAVLDKGVRFDLIDQFEISRGSLFFNPMKQDSLLVEMKSSSGQFMQGIFSPARTVPVKCLEYSNYFGAYGIRFPQLDNPFFNEWLEKKYVNWLAEGKKQLEQRGPTQAPELRNQETAIAWTEVLFLNEQIISGRLFFSSAWEKELKVIPFSFDLKQNRAITPEQLFLAGTNYDSLIKENIKRQVNEAAKRVPPDFHQWMRKADFDQFVISWEGIWAGTSFDPLFGRMELLIPGNILMKSLNMDYWNSLFPDQNRN